MVKRIIFDLDDTLIELDEESIFTLNKGRYSEKEFKKIMQVLLTYEQTHDKYAYDEMLFAINEKLDVPISMTDFLMTLEEYKKLVPKNEKKKEELSTLLKYLSSKYELVVLTNFFTEVQEARLFNYGILECFTKVIGGDIIKCKPNFQSYALACGDKKLEECLMVGDEVFLDVEAPLSFGMQAILYDKDKKHKNTKYKTIQSLNELKEWL